MSLFDLTREKEIKRGEDVVAYDICDNENYDLEALEDSDDGIVRCSFEDTYILYAEWDEEENNWVIDTGDCH